MAAPVLMPQVGMSVESCIITSWVKKTGDKIEIGDILFSYETDKSSLECESTEAGELLDIFFQDGDEVPVLVPVCVIGKAGEDISQWRPGTSEKVTKDVPAAKIAETVDIAEEAVASVSTKSLSTEDLKISPRARKLSEKHYVDITKANPSGPYGRIIENDVRSMIDQGIGIMTPASYELGSTASSGTGIGGRVSVNDNTAITDTAPTLSSQTEDPEYEDIAFTGIRRAISKNMSHSLESIPQLTHNFSFDATQIMAYRKEIKASMEALDLPNITFNDFILYAVSRVILKYPELNAHIIEANSIRRFKDVHLGMAVDTARGLMVPVIKYANRKTLAQISREAKELAEEAISGSISPDKLGGATFTISNLGTMGVETFTPVINPPETGILGVCNITQRVRKVADELEMYPVMGLSLTYDHRAIDGAPASRFALELCKTLEKFTALLAK